MYELFVCFLLLIFPWGRVRADEPSYEANRALIPIGGFVLYYNTRGPLSYVSMTRKELPKGAVLLPEVRGKSCQYGLSLPTELTFRPTSVSGAHGNGGFFKALEDIRARHPDVSGIFDVKVDLHTLAILGIFQRQCTEIVARGFKV